VKARRISAVLCSGDLGKSQEFYEQVATTPGVGKSAWFTDRDGNMLALFQSE
jgi:hypothetical protein